jgi:hypothetical protein
VDNIPQLYILSKPIETELGNIHFFKVSDYDILLKYVPYIELSKSELVNKVFSIDKDLGKLAKELQMIELINMFKDLYNKYQELFLFCFKKDVFYKIDNDNTFEYYIDLIRKMNLIEHEEKNPNPEIQYFNDLKKLYDKKKSNGDITFESIYTSVAKECGNPDDMSIYKMYALFNRICQFQNHQTTVLYSSVSGGDKVSIDPWYKHVDLTKKERETMTLDQFENKVKNMMEN